MFFFFFFQAEDGIRDGRVTGVQTCALPIFVNHEIIGWPDTDAKRAAIVLLALFFAALAAVPLWLHWRGPWTRSEERRVGKECRSRWSPYREKKKERKRGENGVGVDRPAADA